MRKREIKIIVPFRSVPSRCVIENSKKIKKKFKKIKKYHYEFISSQNRLEKDEKKRNKNYHSIPFRSIPTRCVIENSIKIVKNSKNKRNTITVNFKPK